MDHSTSGCHGRAIPLVSALATRAHAAVDGQDSIEKRDRGHIAATHAMLRTDNLAIVPFRALGHRSRTCRTTRVKMDVLISSGEFSLLRWITYFRFCLIFRSNWTFSIILLFLINSEDFS